MSVKMKDKSWLGREDRSASLRERRKRAWWRGVKEKSEVLIRAEMNGDHRHAMSMFANAEPKRSDIQARLSKAVPGQVLQCLSLKWAIEEI